MAGASNAYGGSEIFASIAEYLSISVDQVRSKVNL